MSIENKEARIEELLKKCDCYWECVQPILLHAQKALLEVSDLKYEVSQEKGEEDIYKKIVNVARLLGTFQLTEELFYLVLKDR